MLLTAVLCATGDGDEWQEGNAVAGVLYSRAAQYEGGSVGREEATALAHLTIVCDGMYSSLRGTFSIYAARPESTINCLGSGMRPSGLCQTPCCDPILPRWSDSEL